jgi:hypothetical protein
MNVEDRYEALKHSDSDEMIAEVCADYLLASGRRRFNLGIMHDMRKRSTQGPCPLPFDWRYKNTVGIITRDYKLVRCKSIDNSERKHQRICQ